VRISCPTGLYIEERRPEAVRELVRGEIEVRVESPEGAGGAIYRVQVAALSDRQAADELARRLSEQFGLPSSSAQRAGSRAFQVRVGAFGTRDEAVAFARGSLAAGGYRDTFVVQEAAPGAAGAARAVVRGPESLLRVSEWGYLILPAEAEPLRLDGKPYRGLLDLVLNREGRLTVVNTLGVEEYLLGVVPAELPPVTYPESAALRAQSVAARTYALKNLGRFQSDGFDLTADERSQVYGGVALEKEGSTEAVRATEGMALYHQGALIVAMYSSTCGGHTEEYANVFGGAPVPYLTGVACGFEARSLPELELQGRHDLDGPITTADGATGNRNLELARVLGLSGTSAFTREFLAHAAEPAELRAWVGRASSAVRRQAAPVTDGADLRTRAGFLHYAAQSFFGSEIERRLTAGDVTYYLASLRDRDQIPQRTRAIFAYLIQNQLWAPGPDNRADPRSPVVRADALAQLARWVDAAGNALRSGILDRPDRSQLVLRATSRPQTFPLATELRLFRVADGRSTPIDTLRLVGGEKLRFHVASDGAVDFLEIELTAAGTSSDRFSPQATWQATLTRREIAAKLRPLAGDIGEVVDLEPARLGTSGRAVEIRVQGSRGSVVLNGYRVRQALGLRDTLFRIRRTQGADGSIESFTFDGRGFGHGVGLCQTGAVGMARAGRSYEEILKAYYRGVELRRAY